MWAGTLFLPPEDNVDPADRPWRPDKEVAGKEAALAQMLADEEDSGEVLRLLLLCWCAMPAAHVLCHELSKLRAKGKCYEKSVYYVSVLRMPYYA